MHVDDFVSQGVNALQLLNLGWLVDEIEFDYQFKIVRDKLCNNAHTLKNEFVKLNVISCGLFIVSQNCKRCTSSTIRLGRT